MLNILQFGGDPSHVVIHGVSAGAGSVALHLTAYGGRNDNLFIGAIGESIFFPWQPPFSELEFQFSRLVSATPCINVTNPLPCLRDLDVSLLQRLDIATPFPNGTLKPLFYWTAAVDGDLIRDLPARMIAQGKFIHVPIIFGTDTDDGSSFAPNALSPLQISQFFKSYYPTLSPSSLDAINAHYPLNISIPWPGHAPYFGAAAAAYGESTFMCPSLSITSAYTRFSDPEKVWAYRYNGQGRNGSATILVTHTVELPAVFGTGMVRDRGTSFESWNAPMVDTLMDYWVSFVRVLDPNVFRWGEAPVWGCFGDGGGENRIMFQTNRTGMERVDRALLGRCEFWDGLVGEMET